MNNYLYKKKLLQNCPMLIKKQEKNFVSTMNTKYKKMEDMIIKLQKLIVETKLKFNQAFSNFFDEVKYFRQKGKSHFEEDSSSKNAQRIAMNMLEILLIWKFFQTNPK